MHHFEGQSVPVAADGVNTPAICTYLIHVTGNRAMPGLWLSAAALIGLGATVMLSPRRLETAAVLPAEVG